MSMCFSLGDVVFGALWGFLPVRARQARGRLLQPYDEIVTIR